MKFLVHLQKYHGIYLLIVGVIFLVLWFPNRAVNRYAVSNNCLIVDTRTGQTWLKTPNDVIDWGTIDNPKESTDAEMRKKTTVPPNNPDVLTNEEMLSYILGG